MFLYFFWWKRLWKVGDWHHLIIRCPRVFPQVISLAQTPSERKRTVNFLCPGRTAEPCRAVDGPPFYACRLRRRTFEFCWRTSGQFFSALENWLASNGQWIGLRENVHRKPWSIYHEIWGFPWFSGVNCSPKAWTSRDPARSYPRWDEVKGLLQDTPFFEEKNWGKSWNSRRCHGFNMFQCISMVSLDHWKLLFGFGDWMIFESYYKSLGYGGVFHGFQKDW